MLVLSTHLQNNKPLYSFEDSSDYVYDVMWSPTHPALFACVDGVGHLDLWNLNNDTEVSHHMLPSAEFDISLLSADKTPCLEAGERFFSLLT